MNYSNYLEMKWNDIRQLKKIIVYCKISIINYERNSISYVQNLSNLPMKRREKYNIHFLKFDSIETVKKIKFLCFYQLLTLYSDDAGLCLSKINSTNFLLIKNPYMEKKKDKIKKR